MYLDFGLILNLVLFAVGAYWCYEMFGRWRSDLSDFRELDDNLQKLVILGLWLLMFFIAALVANAAFGVIASIF